MSSQASSSSGSSPSRPSRRRSRSPYGSRYPCKQPSCDRSFSQPSQLKIHMNTHTGDKPYECNFCSKAFGDPASCNRHEKEVHNKSGGVTYECPQCHTHIRRPVAFRQHMQQKHDMDMESYNEYRVAPRPGHHRRSSSSSNPSVSPTRKSRSMAPVPPVPAPPEGLIPFEPLTGNYPPGTSPMLSPEPSPVLAPQWMLPLPALPPLSGLGLGTGVTVFGDSFLPDLSLFPLAEPGKHWRSECGLTLSLGTELEDPFDSPFISPCLLQYDPLLAPQSTSVY